MGLAAFQKLDAELVGRLKGGLTLDVIDAVLLEEIGLDTTGKSFDRRLLGGKHLGKVELNTRNINTTVLEIMLSLMEDVRVVKPMLKIISYGKPGSKILCTLLWKGYNRRSNKCHQEHLVSQYKRSDKISLGFQIAMKVVTHLETELSSLDSSNISTRSTTDDDYVVRFRSRSETTGGLEESKFREAGRTGKGRRGAGKGTEEVL